MQNKIMILKLKVIKTFFFKIFPPSPTEAENNNCIAKKAF
jgi:hypothetical protein